MSFNTILEIRGMADVQGLIFFALEDVYVEWHEWRGGRGSNGDLPDLSGRSNDQFGVNPLFDLCS